MNKPIQSVSYDQQQIINDILQLHNNGDAIDVDLTYSKGVFYKNGVVKEPIHKFDLTPQVAGTIQASSDDIPLGDASVKCIMFDPPFVIAGKTYKDNAKGSSKIAKRFSAYENYDDLMEHYGETLKEAYRLLKDDGILIVKCQNTVSGGKQYFSHFFLMSTAIQIGFYPKDEFVLVNKSKMTSFGGRWNKQEHAMKHHSYFLVFKKKKVNLKYDKYVRK